MVKIFKEGSVWQRKAEEGKAKLYAAVKANFFIPQKFFEIQWNTEHRAPIYIKMT